METFLAVLTQFGRPLVLLAIVLLLGCFVLVPLLRLLGQGKAGKAGMAGRGGGGGKAGGTRSPSRAEIDALAEELEASLRKRRPTLSDQERIARLAQSDPEKAKELVRRWLRQ